MHGQSDSQHCFVWVAIVWTWILCPDGGFASGTANASSCEHGARMRCLQPRVPPPGWTVEQCMKTFLSRCNGSLSIRTEFWAEGRNLLFHRSDWGKTVAPLKFYVKGVAYGAVPIGHDPDNPNDPFNESFTAALGPTCGRDFGLLRDLGANAIRLYSATPYHDGLPCLDQAWNGGVSPIFVILCVWIDQRHWKVLDGPTAELRTNYLGIVEKYRKHPAVMGFTIGAEGTPFFANKDHPEVFWQQFSIFVTDLRTALQGARKIFTIAGPDLDSLMAADQYDAPLDVYGFDWYLSPTWDPVLKRLITLKHEKPVLVMEYGYPASTRVMNFHSNLCYGVPVDIANMSLIADSYTPLTAGLRQNFEGKSPGNYPPFFIGGMVFEFCDEWWKAINPSTHDPGIMPAVALEWGVNVPPDHVWRPSFPGQCHDEEYFGMYAIAPGDQPGDPDRRIPRLLVDFFKKEFHRY